MNQNQLDNNHLEHIKVDPFSGTASVHIPITRLVANNRQGPTFDVELVHRGGNDEFHLAMTHIVASNNPNHPYLARFNDGSTIEFGKQNVVTPSFVIEVDKEAAVVLIHHRDGTLEKFVRQSSLLVKTPVVVESKTAIDTSLFILESITSPQGRQIKFVWKLYVEDTITPKKRPPVYTCQLFEINDEYRTLLRFDAATLPQPQSLTLYPDAATNLHERFAYDLSYEVLSAANKAIWDEAADKIYCHDGKQKTETKLKPSDLFSRVSVIVCATGDMPYTRTFTYTDDNQIQAVQVQLSKLNTKGNLVSSSETLTWSLKQVKTLVRSRGVGLADETLTYSYKAEQGGRSVTIDTSGLRKSKMVNTYNATGRLIKEAITEGGKTRITEQNITYDKARGVSLGETLVYFEGAKDSAKTKVKWEMDSEGNLIMLEEDGIRTNYTYCTTMHFYKSSYAETGEKADSLWSFFYSPGYGAYALFKYIFGAREEIRTIHHVAKGFEHAAKDLGLPLPLRYPGDRQLFDRYVESEIIHQVEGDGSLVPLRARWFSYSGLKPLNPMGAALNDGKVPVLEYVITVLNPQVALLDTFDTRVKAMTDSIGVMGSVLTRCMKEGYKKPTGTGDKQEMAKRVKFLTDLVVGLDKDAFAELFVGFADSLPAADRDRTKLAENLLKRVDDHLLVFNEQVASKSQALQLAKLDKGGVDHYAVSVEKTTYSSDKDSYGLPSTIEFYTLDDAFKEIEGSKLTTTLTYAYDASRQEFKTDTVVKATGNCESGDSRVCSALTGKVLKQTTDTAQIIHDSPFVDINTKSVSHLKIGDAATATPQSRMITTYKYENEQYHRDESNGGGKETRRTTFDLLGRQISTSIIRPKIEKGTNKEVISPLSITTYDDHGRVKGYSLCDYIGSAEGLKLLSTYSVTWTYDDKGTTLVRTLSDAEGNELDSVTEVQGTGADGQSTITRGKTVFNSKVDTDKGTLVEWKEDGTYPMLATVTTHDRWGTINGIEYLSLTDKQTSDSLLHREITRDRQGRPTSIKQTCGKEAASTMSYTYDAYGRPTLIESAGVKVKNVFPLSTGVSIALSASITEDEKTIELGTQKHDGFGRVTEETPKGIPTATFTYQKGSRWGRQTGFEPAQRLPSMADFKSVLNLGTLEYSEHCDGLDSKSGYSLQGRLVSFTDIAGNVTTMSYDVNGRFKTISTEGKAETVFQYRSDGLLQKETVKDLVSKKTMVVTYAYDLMGFEISRSFECEGFDTLCIERTLLGDGRLKKSTLKVADVERRSDNYTYQDCGRLDKWFCTGEDAPVNHYGKKYFSQKFTYDVLGDVIRRDNNTSDGDSVSTYTYSEAMPGVLTHSGSDPQQNDKYGRLTQRSSRKLTYYDNGLIKNYNSGASGDSGLYTFSYDDFGCIRDLTLGTDYRETYHYRGNKMYGFQQLEDNGNKVRGYHERMIVLLNESPSCYLQQIRTTKELKGKEVITTTFELRDAAGSIFASYDLSTSKVSYFTYSAFGYRPPQPSSPTWLGFKGEPLNAVSLYHLGRGYRLYDPQLHRFQSRDSWSPFGRAGANGYCYCCSDPVNNHDPSGHMVEVWSDRRQLPTIWEDNWQLIVNSAITLASIALAPFSGGASIGLRLASTAIAMALGGLSLLSYQLSKTNPNLAMVIDLALICTGRFAGANVAKLSKSTAFVGRKTAMKSAMMAERRSRRLISRADDAVFLSSLSLWGYGAGNSIVSALGTGPSGADEQTLRAQWNSPFLTRPDIAGRQHQVGEDEYLSMTHVDQFLKRSPPLRDAIARAWGSAETIDVVKVMRDYIASAGTANMLNQSPLSADHKVLHDVAMYGLLHNHSDGMYCRGNSVSIITDQVGEGFVPFVQRPDLAL